VKIRRIVVGLEDAPHSRPALAAAAALAEELDAELAALFVENEELHRLAALPFARELGLATAAARRIDAAGLQRALDRQAREARAILAAFAEPRALRWSMRVTRGTVAAELPAAAGEEDLTVAGLPRWSPEAMRFARGAPATLVVLPQGIAPRGPLAGICPVAVAPARALALLSPLSRAVGDGLTLLVLARSVAAARDWCATMAGLLQQHKIDARIEIVRERQPEALQAALERLSPRAVAIVAPEAGA